MYHERLEQLRTENQLTKRDIAREFNVSESTYGKWELGRRKPDTDTIIKLANYFSVSVDYLLGISDNAKPYGSTHYFIENGLKYVRKYNNEDGLNKTYLLIEDETGKLIEKEAPTELTPMEAAVAYFYTKKGRNPTDEELDMFIAFTKPVLDSLPDKAD